ncbi:MAG TPA: hypothetical protein VIT19_07780 [Pyrinomonadaceae bacterium]
MSEVRLNLIDSQQILQGTIHGSIADACIAALSAEPETIGELQAALARYHKPIGDAAELGSFSSFCSTSEINTEPWDAGVVIIDLAAQIVAAESTYSQPDREGEVRYHNGTQSTDVPVLYRVSGEWIFLNSIAEYESTNRQERSRPLIDARSILYGRPMLEFIVTNVRQSPVCLPGIKTLRLLEQAQRPGRDTGAIDSIQNPNREVNDEEEETGRALGDEISAIHARWLTTSRGDLERQAPRDVLLEKRELIDFDMHTRMLQWSDQGEGPPCLSKDSYAYRFAGFGTHECLIYYDLVRLLLWSSLEHQSLDNQSELFDPHAEIKWLEEIKCEWLESPQGDFDGRIPAILIDNERKRLPITLQAKDMIVDDNCEICVMSAGEIETGYGPGFWHLDGSSMDEGFAFSFCRTREEWDEENRRQEEFNLEFNRKWKEREERIARGEPVEDEFSDGWSDSSDSDPLFGAPEHDDESSPIH